MRSGRPIPLTSSWAGSAGVVPTDPAGANRCSGLGFRERRSLSQNIDRAGAAIDADPISGLDAIRRVAGANHTRDAKLTGHDSRVSKNPTSVGNHALDLAEDLIRLSGLEPDVDIKIEYIGLRPGEKLYEELITEGEGIVATSHEKIMVLQGATCDLKLLNGKIDELAALAKKQDRAMIMKKLQEVVPEYQATI